MNKKASTESNTSFAVLELIIAIPIAIMLVGLIFYGFDLLLQDDVSTQIYTTTVAQTNVLLEEIKKPSLDTIEGSYPIQIHDDSYIQVHDEKTDTLCLYKRDNNKLVDCHTFPNVNIITIDKGVMPAVAEGSSVKIIDIMIAESKNNIFTINYALQ